LSKEKFRNQLTWCSATILFNNYCLIHVKIERNWLDQFLKWQRDLWYLTEFWRISLVKRKTQKSIHLMLSYNIIQQLLAYACQIWEKVIGSILKWQRDLRNFMEFFLSKEEIRNQLTWCLATILLNNYCLMHVKIERKWLDQFLNWQSDLRNFTEFWRLFLVRRKNQKSTHVMLSYNIIQQLLPNACQNWEKVSWFLIFSFDKKHSSKFRKILQISLPL
jgi:hypothetical protein